MKFSTIASLARVPVAGVWYRALATQHYVTALQTSHTTAVASRFNPGPFAAKPFETLYLAQTSLVAEFEIGAVFGELTSHISHPLISFTTVAAHVQLSRVVDISDVSQHSLLDTDAQALTGDWAAYQRRSPKSPVHAPVGLAPTQVLGDRIFDDPDRVEGIIAISARIPTHKTLAVFPQNMRKGNFIRYTFDVGAGNPIIHRIEGTI